MKGRRHINVIFVITAVLTSLTLKRHIESVHEPNVTELVSKDKNKSTFALKERTQHNRRS